MEKLPVMKNGEILDIEQMMQKLEGAFNKGGVSGLDWDYLIKNPGIADLIEFKAVAGNIRAVFWLGLIYIQGCGRKLNIARGLKLLKKCAAEGMVEPCWWIGLTYNKLNNAKKAAEYFLKGAENGCSVCMHEISKCYLTGSGVKPDRSEWHRWKILAAGTGNPKSQTVIGFEYLLGKDVEKNLDLAVWWFKEAANNGSVDAAEMLGMIYRNGFDDYIAQDIMASAYWYEMAWKNGSESSFKKYMEAYNAAHLLKDE